MTLDYTVEIDFDMDGLYDHAKADVSALVEEVSFNIGFLNAAVYVAPVSRLTMKCRNDTGQWYTANPAAEFYGLLQQGLQVKVTVGDGADSRVLYRGRIDTIPATPYRWSGSNATVTVTAAGPFNGLVNKEITHQEVYTDKRVDEAILIGLNNSNWAWPYERSGFVIGASTIADPGGAVSSTDAVFWDATLVTDFDEAQVTLGFVGDSTGTVEGENMLNYLIECCNAELFGRLFYEPATDKIKFLNRDTQYSQAVGVTFAGDDLNSTQTPPLIYGGNVINELTVGYTSREAFTSYSKAWEYKGDSFKIKAGKTRKMRAAFTAEYVSGDTDAICAVTEPEALVAGTHYSANESADGSGADRTSSLGIKVDWDARKATIELSASQDLYVTTLYLRGKGLITYKNMEVTERDALSIYDHGLLGKRLQVNMVSADTNVSYLAQSVVRDRKDPAARFQAVAIDPNTTATNHGALFDLQIMDKVRVTVDEDWTCHDEYYMVIGAQHRITAENNVHTISYYLEPTSYKKVFLIGIEGYSEIDENTYLVY